MSADNPLPCHNLERKCRHADLESARGALARLPGARLDGVRQQIDTYFHAANGRLKLRVSVGGAELIWYDRPDAAGLRGSTYHKTAVADAAGLLAALAQAQGVRGEVRKQREVWLWHNVRIHLDLVEGLGSFVELEAVIDRDNDEAISLVRLENLAAVLGLDAANDIAGGYAELLGW